MTVNPRISVIIPVYNASLHLSEAMESILGQSFQDYEIIAVDDGSTDDSLEVLQSFAKLDDRVRIVHQENAGIVSALNRSVSMANGSLLFRMDADDVSLPDRFEKQIAYLDSHPQCIALGMGVELMDESGRALRIMQPPHSHDKIDEMGLQGVGAAIFHPTVAIRKDAFDEVDGYRAKFVHAQDVDLFLRLAEVGRLANLPDIGLRYRVHLSSVGYSRRAEQVKLAKQAASDARERRGLQQLSANNLQVKNRNLFDTQMMWAWWALGDGHLATARHYAKRAMCLRPYSPQVWKLFVCAMRGY
jgi:glycosyltransferase involved in cell wall biosynthesis